MFEIFQPNIGLANFIAPLPKFLGRPNTCSIYSVLSCFVHAACKSNIPISTPSEKHPIAKGMERD